MAARLARAVGLSVSKECVARHESAGIGGRGPVPLQFDKRGLGLWLISGAIGGQGGQHERQRNSQQDQDFHVQILTRVRRNKQER